MLPEIAKEFSTRFNSLASQLSDDDLNAFIDLTSLIEIPHGRKLLKSRMPVDSIYMTLSGRLDVFAENQGKELKVSDVGPGEWLGEISVLSGEGRASATVTAATDVRLLRLKHQAFEELIAGEGELGVLILQYLVLLMSKRLLGLVKMLEERLEVTPDAGKPAVDHLEMNDKSNYWPECRLADASTNFASFLYSLPGIENFTKKDLQTLQNKLKLTLYPSGHKFTIQGQRGESLYLVVDGAVSQRTYDPFTNSSNFTVLNVGEWFALASLLKEQREFSTVTAVKPVFVASLSRDDFDHLFDDSRAITRFILYMVVKDLARKVQTTLNLVVN